MQEREPFAREGWPLWAHIAVGVGLGIVGAVIVLQVVVMIETRLALDALTRGLKDVPAVIQPKR